MSAPNEPTGAPALDLEGAERRLPGVRRLHGLIPQAGLAVVAEIAALDMEALIAAVRERDQEIAKLWATCPDCGSPMPGEMCAVCALAYAEEELVRLREDAARLDWIESNPRLLLRDDRDERCWRTRRDTESVWPWPPFRLLREAIDAARKAQP